MIYYFDNLRHIVCYPYSLQNLHIMARDLGISKYWFHSKRDKSHYDIPLGRMGEIRLNEKCKEVSPKVIMDILKGEYNEN